MTEATEVTSARRAAIELRDGERWPDLETPDADVLVQVDSLPIPAADHALELLAATAEHPVPLTGEHGLLTSLVGEVLQLGLEVELARHLGHGRWEWSGRGASNIRNGAYAKRVVTDLGAMKLQMPRDRRGTFDPIIVPKHGRRLLSPTASLAAVHASGMTRSEIRIVIDSVTGSRLDAATLDGFLDELEPRVRATQRRRFQSTCPILLLDSITLLGRGRRPSRRALDVALAIDAYGDAELLGLWRRHSRSAGAGRHTPMLDELRYRGISDVTFIVGSGDAELNAAGRLVWPEAEVRSGVEALVENVLRTQG